MAQVLVATTPEERHAIYRFRYDVYVEEMGKNPRYANHTDRVLKDDLDETATLLYLKIDDRIVATVRRNALPISSLSVTLRKALAIDRFTAEFSEAQLCFDSRFMIAPEWRNSFAAGLIVAEVYRLGREQGVQFDFSHASPWLVPFYENLGFRRYTSNFLDEDAGLQIPMVMLLEDVDHLRSVHSPFYRLARRMTNQSTAKDWFVQAFPQQQEFFNPYQHSLEEVWEFWLKKRRSHPDQRVALFQDLTEENLKRLLRHGAFHPVKAGEAILRLGDISNSVFVVLSGAVQRSSLTHTATPATHTLGPYQIFGESALFTELPSPEQVMAISDTELLVLPRQAMMRVMKTMPEAICQLFLYASRSVCERYVPTNPNRVDRSIVEKAA
jgi:predicted GNAT family N-acyltransferase